MRLGSRLLTLGCALFASPAAATTVGPVLARSEVKLTAAVASGGNAGISVAISGDTAVVGAMLDDGGALGSGAAYVFVRSGGVWAQQAKLTASDGAAADLFGVSVAIDGDTAVVGAVGDDDAGTASGSAYVFVRSGGVWTQQAKLTASDAAAGDYFGQSVSVSADTAVVGAFYHQDAGYASGSAYVFVRSAGMWSQQAKLDASDAAPDDYFGFAVAVDGDSALIGAPENDDAGTQSGSAYVFVRSGGVWSQQAKLTASNASAQSFFGIALAIAGDNAIIGTHPLAAAGSAYVFVRSGSAWSEEAVLTAPGDTGTDAFGVSVAIGADTALVGAWGSHDAGTDSGAAYVFGRAGTSWGEQAKIVATDATAADEFGTSVAIAGTTAIVGAPYDDGAGSAYVYELAPGQNVGGTLSITNQLPDDPTHSRLRFGSRSASIAPATPGASGDPRCSASSGGSIQVTSKTSGQNFSQALPCALWTPIGNPASPLGYQYLDRGGASGPCRRLSIRAGKLAANCGGRGSSQLVYDLQVGQSEAPVTVFVDVGSEAYCARLGGTVKRDGSSGLSFSADHAPTITACE